MAWGKCRFLSRLLAAIAFCALVAPQAMSPAQSRAPAPSEYEIKAAYLFNFAQFVEWPAEAFKNGDSPIIIGIFGADPFGKSLDDIVRDQIVGGRRIVIKRLARPRDMDDCHVLFVGLSEKSAEKSIIESLKGKTVLTVGECPDFIKHGGMIRFAVQKRKVGLEINLEKTRSENLKVSSKLLKIAKVV